MRAIGAGRGFGAQHVRRRVRRTRRGIGVDRGRPRPLVTVVLRAMHIEATNQFFLVLFGGKYMNPVATAGNVLMAILVMILVGFIAHLYPVSLALKIQPVRAMQEE